MKKEIKAWAVIGREGLFYWWSISETRKEVMRKFESNYSTPWSRCYGKFGYRIHRVTITVEE